MGSLSSFPRLQAGALGCFLSHTPLPLLAVHLDQTCLWVFQNTGVFQNLLLWPTDDSHPGHICPGPGVCSCCQKNVPTASYLACHCEPGCLHPKHSISFISALEAREALEARGAHAHASPGSPVGDPASERLDCGPDRLQDKQQFELARAWASLSHQGHHPEQESILDCHNTEKSNKGQQPNPL